ncbi:hypothetical protein IW261DRAFT_1428784 [Armillaria novae-zelandiae]|uniref:Uncharacterized protein n=1 Tax=Armillaria novae-zelandiae TaxID=153914 RepID=A0AA39T2Z6_9AGAR|nr:hypothetical protein IW261DRAFT_1428784 [Armillaria novae-zelandiae]
MDPIQVLTQSSSSVNSGAQPQLLSAPVSRHLGHAPSVSLATQRIVDTLDDAHRSDVNAASYPLMGKATNHPFFSSTSSMKDYQYFSGSTKLFLFDLWIELIRLSSRPVRFRRPDQNIPVGYIFGIFVLIDILRTFQSFRDRILGVPRSVHRGLSAIVVPNSSIIVLSSMYPTKSVISTVLVRYYNNRESSTDPSVWDTLPPFPSELYA